MTQCNLQHYRNTAGKEIPLNPISLHHLKLDEVAWRTPVLCCFFFLLCWHPTSTTTDRAPVKSGLGDPILHLMRAAKTFHFLNFLHWPQHKHEKHCKPPLWRFQNGTNSGLLLSGFLINSKDV